MRAEHRTPCEPPGPAFYAYAYPEPEGFRSANERARRMVSLVLAALLVATVAYVWV